MNEQLQKLYEQSFVTDTYVNVGPDGAKLGIKFDPEKFAELIVRECCDQLVKEGNDWEQFSRNPPAGQAHHATGALFAAYRLKEDAVDMLKEHFGINN